MRKSIVAEKNRPSLIEMSRTNLIAQMIIAGIRCTAQAQTETVPEMLIQLEHREHRLFLLYSLTTPEG